MTPLYVTKPVKKLLNDISLKLFGDSFSVLFLFYVKRFLLLCVSSDGIECNVIVVCVKSMDRRFSSIVVCVD